MKEKIIKYTKEIITFFIFITILANIISFYKSSDLNKESLQNINITLLDSQKYNYPKDKPLLIHFWATWCPTCKLEASNIQTISENFEVLTIAVSSGDDYEVKKYMHEHDLNYKVYNDANGFFAKEFNIAAYPTTFIYDKNKNLVFSEVGFTSTLGLWLRMWLAGL
ncbi:putative thioredoxin [Sulfurimonas gotlandica GD1]|jgi:thiol-disulfide isomerase/thioredoxin|uniref:Putative thioredoxin n=1 Tax=Sulfurimonas gotlandica (strain DSM 19862 / JCM 16533 / GD1) TaxID=929558 RepID=H1FWJ7_SULGG|nr:redoxin domain-containing protein [Sulfurimonas gotlandica]EHP29238.1 putative thioredoxin [Sulfurimonas gotlandica GD1]